jgi:hypothetical protein
MLEKEPGISISDKLCIIHLLRTDLNQVLRIEFLRHITQITKERKFIISEHQYGQAHKICMTPVFNKLLILQLIIQRKWRGQFLIMMPKGDMTRSLVVSHWCA